MTDNSTSRAVALLHCNLTPQGILAATRTPEAEARRYTRIFARDAAICALGMVLTEDAALIKGAVKSLMTLANHQAANGQIPKYVDPHNAEADFWYLGCIDATLWWLVALHQCQDHIPNAARTSLHACAAKALTWLHCQEHPRLFLLQQNEASDWADIMPRSGFVLYSNALWYYVKRLYNVPHREATHQHFNQLFFPCQNTLPDYHRLRLLSHYARHRADNRDLYLSFVNFSFFGAEGDVFGNLLAILFGLADDGRTHSIINALRHAGIDRPYPVRAVVTPIQRADALWRPYMGRHRQNLEYQYHNGGIWPFIGGFWVMALAGLGLREHAHAALNGMIECNRLGDWAFQEWLHGVSYEPRGMRGQSWNAAAVLLAQRSLEQRVF